MKESNISVLCNFDLTSLNKSFCIVKKIFLTKTIFGSTGSKFSKVLYFDLQILFLKQETGVYTDSRVIAGVQSSPNDHMVT